jgi:hypothetical protein
LTVVARFRQRDATFLKRFSIFEKRFKKFAIVRTMRARVEYDLHQCLLFAELL